MAIKKTAALRAPRTTPNAVPKKSAGKGLVKVVNDRPPSNPARRGRRS